MWQLILCVKGRGQCLIFIIFQMNQGDQLCFNSVAVHVISMKDECSKTICFSEVCAGSLPLLPQPLVLDVENCEAIAVCIIFLQI